MSVVQLRTAGGPEPLLTKKQLAAHLERSPRWIELKLREGLPSEAPTARFPHRRFRLSDVEAWLAAGPKKTSGLTDKVAQLEQQLATLAATVEKLERRVR